jgi:hypothetical protein
MLVLEHSDEGVLYLAKGIPRSWLVSGKPIRIKNTPTRWGRVSLELQAEPSGSGIAGKNLLGCSRETVTDPPQAAPATAICFVASHRQYGGSQACGKTKRYRPDFHLPTETVRHPSAVRRIISRLESALRLKTIANPSAQSLLSAGHFGDRKNGAHGRRRRLRSSPRHGALWAAVVRSCGAASLAPVSNGKCRARSNHPRRLDSVSSLQHEKTADELLELRLARRSARPFPRLRRCSGHDGPAISGNRGSVRGYA